MYDHDLHDWAEFRRYRQEIKDTEHLCARTHTNAETHTHTHSDQDVSECRDLVPFASGTTSCLIQPTTKTEEMVINFCRTKAEPLQPVSINCMDIEVVQSYNKFLGVHMTASWTGQSTLRCYTVKGRDGFSSWGHLKCGHSNFPIWD